MKGKICSRKSVKIGYRGRGTLASIKLENNSETTKWFVRILQVQVVVFYLFSFLLQQALLL